MKSILLVLLMLTGCASKCPDCVTLAPAQLGAAMMKAWGHGYEKGFDDGEDHESIKRLKAL